MSNLLSFIGHLFNQKLAPWLTVTIGLFFSWSAIAQNVDGLGQHKKSMRSPKLWYLGIAAHHNSPAFRGDIQTLENLFSKIAPTFQSFKLGNGYQEGKAGWPQANPNQVAMTIRQIATQLAPNDLLVIVLSTHGSQKLLEFSSSSEKWQITPAQMNEWLQPVAKQKTVFMVLACYSGSWANELSANSRIVITSSKWDQTSDGCGPTNKTTEFVKYWQQEFSPELSIRQITTRAGFSLPSAAQSPTFEAGEHMRPFARAKLKEWQQHMASNPP
jgi:Peptidase C13 family